MKKIYVLFVVCLCIAGSGFAQNNFYWIGATPPAVGDWSNGANWSETQGGPTKNSAPNSTSANVFFTGSANVTIGSSVNINSLSVSGANAHVMIQATGGWSYSNPLVITANSTSTITPALSIAAGTQLEDTAALGTSFNFKFVPGAQASINGDWYFTGDVDNLALAYFQLPTTGSSTLVSVNSGGSITIGPKGYTDPVDVSSEDFLVFDDGSALNLMSDFPIVPSATYADNSTINVTGVTVNSVVFEELQSVGNIIYNCPNQANGVNPLYLNLFNLIVGGNLTIQNTNSEELTLLQYDISLGLPSSATIEGNLDIQGTSKVAMSYIDGPEEASDLYVNGNVIANGLGFSLQSSNLVASAPSVLHVGGNINHTAGTFNALSTSTSTSVHLFVVELSGGAGQTVSSFSGTFDNLANQVTLRMNNANGATLNSPLAVGRIDFNTANKGILTAAGTNILTINNTSPVSVSTIVVSYSPNKNEGFVNGKVRRLTASTEPSVLPTGKGALSAGVTVIPVSSTASTFEGEYFNVAHTPNTVTDPLDGAASYYWEVSRINGTANAAVELSFSSAVASAGDTLVVSKFDGANWVSVRGTTGTYIFPGDAVSGTVTSEVQTSFSPFTIGYISQISLPTILVSFTGKKSANEVAELDWKITDNSTPAVFEVMRSADGVNFTRIGSVTGFEGKMNYAFTDNAIAAGNNYYRLKMYDKDRSITYSNIIVIMNGTKGVIISSMIPTLVRDRSKLNISSSVKGNMQLVVTDITGRIIQNQVVPVNAGNQEVWLNAGKLSAGMFQITGYINGEKTATIRFIKQ